MTHHPVPKTEEPPRAHSSERPERTKDRSTKKQYLYGVQGLRTVAALMVAVYHVWFHRVSGGVDVFFVVAGYFAASSLRRTLEAPTARLALRSTRDYLLRTARRVIPSAAVVISATALGSMFWQPMSGWGAAIRGAWASLFFFENQDLIDSATEYGRWTEATSPFQQFWALSIQVQSYVAFALVALLVALLSLALHKKSRHLAVGVVTLLFAASFTISILSTSANQQVAYFSFTARFWEFLFGALLAWLASRVCLPSWLARSAGWLGLLTIVLVPAFLNFSLLLPGVFALVPLTAASAVILSSRHNAEPALLRHPWVLWFADSSFAFYLWHWPLLVFYRTHFGVDVSFLSGLGILLLSALLATLTTKLLENPFRSWPLLMKKPLLSLVASAALLAPPAVLITYWQDQLSTQELAAEAALQEAREAAEAALLEASEQAQSEQSESGGPITPSPHLAKNDKPFTADYDCHQNPTDPEMIVCEWGNPGSDTVIAVVGGSHENQWTDVALVAAEETNSKLLTITKSNCSFGFRSKSTTAVDESCETWSQTVLNQLLEDPPDVVLGMATRREQGREGVPEWKADYIKELLGAGIAVVGVRDNPTFEEDPPACVELRDPKECGMAADSWYAEELVIPADLDDPLFTFVDMSPIFCPDGYCSVVQGSTLVYRDNNHLTRTWTLQHGQPVLNALLSASNSER